jgi:hypothetical protein
VPGNPLRSGFHIGVGAPETDVPFQSLWIRDGRLVNGQTVALAQPYAGNDYFVLHLERLLRRPDWPGLPRIGEFETQFKEIIGSDKPKAERLDALAKIWPNFRETLIGSAYLTRFDAGQIANDVSKDLQDRLKAIELENPFIETRGWRTDEIARRPARDLDFAAVPEVGMGDREEGERALERPPVVSG